MLTEVSGCVVFSEWCENFIDSRLPNVYQHVSIGKPFHGSHLIALRWRQKTIQSLSTIILLEDFFIGHGCNSIIVKLQPPSIPIGLDESEIVATMQVSRVDENPV